MKNTKRISTLFILIIIAFFTLLALLIGGFLLTFIQRASVTERSFNEITPLPMASTSSNVEIFPGSDSADLLPTSTPPTSQEQPTSEAFDNINSGESSSFWISVQDPNHGFRFAIPCFWNANFPDRADFSYTIQNYPPEFVDKFPRGQDITLVGGVKLDISIWDPVDWGQPSGQPVDEFVQNIFANNSESTILAIDHLLINNQPAVLVTMQSISELGQMYLFPYTGDTFLMIGSSQKLIQHPDVQHIINSIALTPDIEIHIPSEQPGNPPVGLSAPCMGGNEPAIGSNETNP